MKRRFSRWYSVLAVVVLAAVALTGCSAAQNGVKPVAPVASNGVPQEGITVHGHWTFDVTNPDGTLAEHREFENALQDQRTITWVLGRTKSVGGWLIFLASNSSSPWVNGTNGPVQGSIAEASYPTSLPFVFGNLVVSVPASGTNAGRLVLSGSATAQISGQIDRVGTRMVLLDATVPPTSTYAGGESNDLTQTTLSPPVTLSAGQQIAVTVVISLS